MSSMASWDTHTVTHHRAQPEQAVAFEHVPSEELDKKRWAARDNFTRAHGPSLLKPMSRHLCHLVRVVRHYLRGGVVVGGGGLGVCRNARACGCRGCGCASVSVCAGVCMWGRRETSPGLSRAVLLSWLHRTTRRGCDSHPSTPDNLWVDEFGR